MNDKLVPLTTNAHFLVDTLHSVDRHVGNLNAKNATNAGEIVGQHLSRPSRIKINQD
jgi:hypothetical protein